MEDADRETLIALLHAHTVALTALYASHPQPAQLSLTLVGVESKSETFAHPAYQETMDALRRAIPSHRS